MVASFVKLKCCDGERPRRLEMDFLFFFYLSVGGNSKEKRGKQEAEDKRGRGRRAVVVASKAGILFMMDGSSWGERKGGGKERAHQSWWF